MLEKKAVFKKIEDGTTDTYLKKENKKGRGTASHKERQSGICIYVSSKALYHIL